MNQPSSDSPSFSREIPGMLIMFVTTVGAMMLAHSLRELVMERFALHGGSPGESPPWYFITRDFADGICSFVALFSSLLIALVTWRWWPSYSSMIVWMSLLWQGGHIAQSWIIGQTCPGLLDGQRISTRWQTFDSYLHDPGIARAESLVRWSALLLAVGLPLADRYIRRRLHHTSP